MSCGPPTMIVAVVDFKDWGLQIIALCDIGLERIITHLATGSERRNGASSSSRRESALTTLPRGEVFYHDLICFAMSLRRSCQDVSCLGDVLLYLIRHDLLKVLSLYLVPSKRKYFPHFGHKLLDSIHHKLLGSKEKKEVVSLLIVDMS